MLSQVRARFFNGDVHPGGIIEVLTNTGDTWGEGLNQLAKIARGDYWLTCCDDTVPKPGWFGPARAMVDAGIMPAQRYFDVNDEPLHEYDLAPHGTPLPWSRGYLLTPEIYSVVGKFIDASWQVDLDYSERLIECGYEIQACDGYAFTHLDGERDWLTDEVAEHERRLYAEARARRVTS
jgi:GT2 family glycosyltransferase